jgi:Ni,Fe-hydrogenase I small subunit
MEDREAAVGRGQGFGVESNRCAIPDVFYKRSLIGHCDSRNQHRFRVDEEMGDEQGEKGGLFWQSGKSKRLH